MQPKVGDTVYIIGRVLHVLQTGPRLVVRIETKEEGLKDSFLMHVDQIRLIETSEEVTECVD